MNLSSLDLSELSNLVGGGAGAGALSTPWVDMVGDSRCHVLIGLDANAEDITVTAEQATDGSGTGAKALLIGHVQTKFGVETKFTKSAAGANYVAAADTAGVVIAEFAIATLDVNAGFRFLQVSLAGSTARVQQMMVLPMGGSF